MSNKASESILRKARASKSILRKARELIADDTHWTKGSYFGSDPNSGFDVSYPQRNQASRFCAVGAIARVGEYDNLIQASNSPEVKALAACVPDGVGGYSPDEKVIEYNDAKNTSHTAILDLFDCAIAEADEE